MADASQPDPDLVGAAARLYGVPPSRFTAERTEAVRAARARGDRDLARELGTLRKPSTAAAAVNLLLRDRPEDVGRLLDLGVRLREAQSALAGADLRALHAEQQQALAAVVPAALSLAAEGAPARTGSAARAQVEATLRAAMGDPDAAAAVATGLLVRDLFSSGFEPVDVAGATAVPGAPALEGAPVRRTPLRGVAAPEPAAVEPTGRPARRRRGRLITAEEPDRGAGVRAVGGGADAVRGGASGRGRERGTGGGRATDRARRAGGEVRGPESGLGREGRGPESGREREGRGREAGRERKAERARDAGRQREVERERDAERARAEREAGRRRAAARRAADEDVSLARDAVSADRAARDAADARVEAADRRGRELAGTLEAARAEMARLREELAAAEREARQVAIELRHARSARTTAQRAAERSQARLRAAERARDEL